MKWIELTEEQIKKMIPRPVVPVVAAMAPEVNDDGGYYADTVFTIHTDGGVCLPMTDIEISELGFIYRRFNELYEAWKKEKA